MAIAAAILRNLDKNKTTQWQSRSFDVELSAKLAAELQLSPLTVQLLLQRQVSPAQIAWFLQPSLQQLRDPLQMLGMPAAVERLTQAYLKKEKIMIHGDYDADGVTSTALFYRFFRQLGIAPLVYIPNRLDENHGINPGAIEQAAAEKVTLFITCDCGVSSEDAIAQLKALQIDTVVTDHHQVPASGMPRDAIVVNPAQDDCNFDNQGMSGVGIVYCLLMAWRRHLRDLGAFTNGTEPNLKDDLDLVTLGTIADQAPLLGQNRIFVKTGLPVLATTSKAGLRSLINLCLNPQRALNVQDVAFFIAPKINAAGRLGKADEAFALLIEDDPVRAAVQARKLLNYNEERRRLEERHMAEAKMQVEQLYGRRVPQGIILYQADWHHGVLGLIAQKIAQRYQTPTIILADKGGMVQGSGRSFGGRSLIDLLSACQQHLQRFGGHQQAAGVALEIANLEEFRQQFSAAMEDHASTTPVLLTDGELDFTGINDVMLQELSQLEPFGEGNPEPCFYCRQVKAIEVRRLGDKRQHLRCVLVDAQGGRIEAVGFSLGNFAQLTDQSWQVLYTPEFNHWQGRRTIQARLHHIEPLP